MGSGKSSVGRIIAQRLGFDFVDSDQLVVEQAGAPITEIFKNHGEEKFRDMETAALESLRGRTGLVLATGGGIVVRENNVALLHGLGFVAWLTASEEIIFDRVSRNTKRPLVQTANPRETIHNLLELRIPLYKRAAHCAIATDSRSHEDVASAVISEAQRAI